MRDADWTAIVGADLASGYLREDVLEAAQSPSWLDEPELPQGWGRIRRHPWGH